MPLSDRDYMRRPSPPPRRRIRTGVSFSSNVLWIIIGINVVLYLVTEINHNAIGYLGLTPSLLAERPWTFVTSMFVHSGFGHVFFNMIALFFFGRTLIMLIGAGKFLLVYFIGGLAGNGLFMLINASPNALLIGASGAVYAVAGALVVMVPNMGVALWGIVPMPLWVFVVVFLVILALPPFVRMDIAWQAHMGGLAVGLIAGWFFRRRIRPDFYR